MRIVGFGACMIGGFGVGSDFSFFNQALDILKLKDINVDFSSVVSFGGVPISLSAKYLDKRVIKLNPDVVIIQFGNTDINKDINKDIKKKLKKIFKIKLSRNSMSSTSSNKTGILKNRLRTKLRFAIKYFGKEIIACILNTKTNTTLDVYISYLDQIIGKLEGKGVKVIVLSPFPSANLFNDKKVLKYTENIKKIKSEHNFILIECYPILKNFDISEFLLGDGSHLSKNGHLILASEIAKVLEHI